MNRETLNRIRALATTLVLGASAAGFVLLASPPALAQPGDTGAPQTADAATERAVLRERLERQLENLERRRDQLRDALDRLDAGAPIDDVRADLLPERAEGRGFGRGPGSAGPSADRGAPGDGRGPRREMLPPGAPNDAAPPSPEQVERMLRFLRAHKPEVAADLEALREKDPEAFERKLAEIGPRLQSLIGRFDEAPERLKTMMELRRTDDVAFDLARRIVNGDTSGTDLTTQLRETVARGFDLRRSLHEQEIDDTRARLDDLETRADEMTTNRDRMIDRHVAELIDMAASGEPMPAPRERWRRFFEEQREGRRREDARPRRERPVE